MAENYQAGSAWVDLELRHDQFDRQIEATARLNAQRLQEMQDRSSVSLRLSVGGLRDGLDEAASLLSQYRSSALSTGDITVGLRLEQLADDLEDAHRIVSRIADGGVKLPVTAAGLDDFEVSVINGVTAVEARSVVRIAGDLSRLDTVMKEAGRIVDRERAAIEHMGIIHLSADLDRLDTVIGKAKQDVKQFAGDADQSLFELGVDLKPFRAGLAAANTITIKQVADMQGHAVVNLAAETDQLKRDLSRAKEEIVANQAEFDEAGKMSLSAMLGVLIANLDQGLDLVDAFKGRADAAGVVEVSIDTEEFARQTDEVTAEANTAFDSIKSISDEAAHLLMASFITWQSSIAMVLRLGLAVGGVGAGLTAASGATVGLGVAIGGLGAFAVVGSVRILSNTIEGLGEVAQETGETFSDLATVLNDWNLTAEESSRAAQRLQDDLAAIPIAGSFFGFADETYNELSGYNDAVEESIVATDRMRESIIKLREASEFRGGLMAAATDQVDALKRQTERNDPDNRSPERQQALERQYQTEDFNAKIDGLIKKNSQDTARRVADFRAQQGAADLDRDEANEQIEKLTIQRRRGDLSPEDFGQQREAIDRRIILTSQESAAEQSRIVGVGSERESQLESKRASGLDQISQQATQDLYNRSAKLAEEAEERRQAALKQTLRDIEDGEKKRKEIADLAKKDQDEAMRRQDAVDRAKGDLAVRQLQSGDPIGAEILRVTNQFEQQIKQATRDGNSELAGVLGQVRDETIRGIDDRPKTEEKAERERETLRAAASPTLEESRRLTGASGASGRSIEEEQLDESKLTRKEFAMQQEKTRKELGSLMRESINAGPVVRIGGLVRTR